MIVASDVLRDVAPTEPWLRHAWRAPCFAPSRRMSRGEWRDAIVAMSIKDEGERGIGIMLGAAPMELAHSG